jgi:hypothetical protein
MADFQIRDLRLAGSEPFQDSESFLCELENEESSLVGGGVDFNVYQEGFHSVQLGGSNHNQVEPKISSLDIKTTVLKRKSGRLSIFRKKSN